MSTFSALEIGKRALQAANFGLDVTNNNIANVTTEGYSRKQAVTSESNPFTKYRIQLGTGVNTETLRSFRQQYLDREIRKANSQLSANDTDVMLFNNLEVIFQEPTDNNLGNVLNDFLSYFDELALQPESIGLRENLLSMSRVMVERLNNASNDIYSMRYQANTDLINQTNEANRLIQEIADCNKAIAISKDPSGNDALTYIDRREVAIEKLSKLGNISVSYEDNNIANVFLNAIDVVTGPDVQTLKVTEDVSATGESSLNIVTYNEKKDTTVLVNPTGGQMGATLKHYNISLDPLDSTGNFSIMQTLDRFANSIATNVNNLFATGYGINDLTAPPQGRALFESTNGGVITAANIKVTDIIAEDIPLSATPNTPGNSEIARQVSRLLQDGDFMDGQQPIEFYSNFIGRISQFANQATSAQKTNKLVVESLNSTRDSVMGVNMDEEAISMIKLQKNLEAAAKIIATNNEVLGIIINLGR